MVSLTFKLKKWLKFLIERYPPIGKLFSSLMSLVEVASLELLNWISVHLSPNFKIRIMNAFRGKWGSRVVPLNVNIPAETKYLPRQEIFEIISRSHLFGIGECYCRTKHQNCQNPTHTCILLSPPQGKSLHDIDYRNVAFKNVSKQEVIDVLEECDKRGLVHQLIYFPTPNYYYVICNCCPCCCESLANYRRFGSPQVVQSDFLESTDLEKCINCGKCVEVCYFSARRMVNGILEIQKENCKGCGLCIRRCDSNAISLIKRKK